MLFLFHRPRCDHCEYRKYGFSYEGCKQCDCDPVGSRELQCDTSGQCSCLENVEGRRCDRCKENKHDRQRGCVDCPECYTLVQEAARSHNNQLDRLKEILDKIERQPIVINDDDFPKELRRVQDDIRKLNEDVRSMVGDDGLIVQLTKLDKTGKDASRTLSEVDENLFLLEGKLSIAERNIENIEEILEEADDKLDEINDVFEYDAKHSLEEATKRAKIAGERSDKMTKLAHEARDLTDDIDSRANEIITKAQEVKNKSIDAYTEVKEANFRQAQFVETIRNIKEDLAFTEKKVNDAMNWTHELSSKASMIKNNATALLSEINNILVPNVNIPQLSNISKNILEEADRLSKKSQELLKNNSDLRQNLEKQNDDREKLLDEARIQQEDIMDLKNDLIFAGEQANAAIKLWSEIHERAITNYKLLSGILAICFITFPQSSPQSRYS